MKTPKTAQKLAFLLLALLLPALLFSGCSGGEKKPLQVCVDLGGAGRYQNNNLSINLQNFLQNLHDFGGPEDVEVEIIPMEGADRDSAIKRIKTELMSGSGPDVFIVDTYDGNFFRTTPVFPIPEQLMNRPYFLPLDDYIEKAQFMEWDKLTPQIMESGRTDEGQIFLPLSYTFLLTCFEKSQASHTPSKDYTWADMLADESRITTAAGIFCQPGNMSGVWFPAQFGHLADYSNEKLLLTEEDLYTALEDQLLLEEMYHNGEFDQLPTMYQNRAGVNFAPAHYELQESGAIHGFDSINASQEQRPLTMIPLYSREGGVTAKVTCYAAVNRNTKRPEEAFFILDYLLGTDAQRYSDVYDMIFRNDLSLPVHMDLMSPDLSCRHWSMSRENFETFRAVRDQITTVTFPDALDWELNNLYWDAREVMWSDDGPMDLSTCGPEMKEQLKKLVSEHYRVMEMVLAES